MNASFGSSELEFHWEDPARSTRANLNQPVTCAVPFQAQTYCPASNITDLASPTLFPANESSADVDRSSENTRLFVGGVARFMAEEGRISRWERSSSGDYSGSRRRSLWEHRPDLISPCVRGDS